MTSKDTIIPKVGLTLKEQKWVDNLAIQIHTLGYVSFQLFLKIMFTDKKRTSVDYKVCIVYGDYSETLWTITAPYVEEKYIHKFPFNFGYMETYIAKKGHKVRLYRISDKCNEDWTIRSS